MAAGFLEIAVANMANAIKKISVQRGYDITRYVLATFGGAGGQHACAVADQLGMTTVLIHPLAGVLSAYGMGLADVTAMRESAVEAELSPATLAAAADLATRLESAARDELAADGVQMDHLRSARRAHLRYAGTDTALAVPLAGQEELVRAFEAAYRQQFSFLMPDKPVLLEAVSVELTAAPAAAPAASLPGPASAAPAGADGEPGAVRVPMFTGGRWAEVDLVPRRGLRPGAVLAGPAIIAEDFATTVVEPGWQAELTGRGDLLLTRAGPAPARRAAGTGADPVLLEIFNNLFMSVAEQMGVRLRSTAHSVNIKERLDFSCAVFDSAGPAHRQRPAHAGAPGLDGREHQDGHQPQRRRHQAR